MEVGEAKAIDEEDLFDEPPATDNQLRYNEIFYLDLGSQSNIYGSTKLRYPTTTQERLIVATLSGKVSCLERCEVPNKAAGLFHSTHDMQAREVSFTYIPGDAEIISIDSFYQHESLAGSKYLAVGITLIKFTGGDHNPNNAQHFFNIYTALQPGAEFDLDNIAQSCEHHPLDYTPYQLTHADVFSKGSGGKYEPVFLVCGSDKKIHMFRGDSLKQQSFVEKSIEKYFPEFASIPGCVMWVDTQNCNDYKRISSLGCDNGYLQVSLTDTYKLCVLASWNLSLDGPISSIRLFCLATERGGYTTTTNFAVSSVRNLCNAEDVVALVTSCLEVSVVYMNVASKGLSDMVILNDSDQYDSVTCSCISDIDCDGNNEVILGTYGQELLVYKAIADIDGQVRWDLLWKRQFSKPLLAINCLDLMGDGMMELVVVSLTGVHILQPDVQKALEILLTKFVRHPEDYIEDSSDLNKQVKEIKETYKLERAKKLSVSCEENQEVKLDDDKVTDDAVTDVGSALENCNIKEESVVKD